MIHRHIHLSFTTYTIAKITLVNSYKEKPQEVVLEVIEVRKHEACVTDTRAVKLTRLRDYVG